MTMRVDTFGYLRTFPFLDPIKFEFYLLILLSECHVFIFIALISINTCWILSKTLIKHYTFAIAKHLRAIYYRSLCLIQLQYIHCNNFETLIIWEVQGKTKVEWPKRLWYYDASNSDTVTRPIDTVKQTRQFKSMFWDKLYSSLLTVPIGGVVLASSILCCQNIEMLLNIKMLCCYNIITLLVLKIWNLDHFCLKIIQYHYVHFQQEQKYISPKASFSVSNLTNAFYYFYSKSYISSEAEKFIFIVYSYFFFFVEPVCISFTFGGLKSHLKKFGEAHRKTTEDSVGKGW